MRCSQAIAAVVLAALFGGGWASAATKPDRNNPPSPASPAPRPASAAASHPRPAPPPRQPQTAAPARNASRSDSRHDADRHHDGHDEHHPHLSPNEYILYYNPWYGYFYPYDYYGYWPSLDSFGLGPAVQDTSRYGGADNAVQPWPNDRVARAAPPADDPPERKVRAQRADNSRQDELASKYIDYGDALFAKQKYVEANDRYRKAARSAPQLAVAWFRQGFALAAIGRCDQAAVAIKRGLKLDPAWPKSNFSLDRLFGGNAAAKDACLDAAAAATKEKPADSDRLFLLGVLLHFDGQDNRAAATFARAEQTAGNNIGHIEAFMDQKE